MITMRNLIISFWVFSVVLLASACNKKEAEPTISEDFNMSGIVLPDEIERFAGETVELRVLGGHGPVVTDEVQLAGAVTCRMPVKEASANRFSFELSRELYSGDYKLSIVRDGRVRNVGNTRLLISTADPIDPQGATVYGQVSAQGKGLANVAVSDGVEVVQTDENGIYRMNSQKRNGYVFISVPSGYEPFSNGILPCIHKQLKASKTETERMDFSLRPVEGQDNATVLVMGDIHLARRTNDRAQFAEFINDVNEYTATHPGKIYGLTLGDMTWDQFWKVNTYGYADYLRDANSIKGLMIYQTIGNHDHSMYYPGDFETVVEYKQTLAPTYYSFNIGKAHFVVLDDVLCTNSTKDTDSKGNPCYERTYTQKLCTTSDVSGIDIKAWLIKDLALVPKNQPLVITMHIPVYSDSGSDRGIGSVLESCVSGFSDVHFFTAHTHDMYNVVKSSKLYEHNAGSVCGTWWWTGYDTPGVNIGPDGTPGGYTVLSLDGTSVKWQYKAAGFPLSYQFRTYDRNEIYITPEKYAPSATNQMKSKMMTSAFTGPWTTASSANEVYINVWNYDPSWTVEVTEDGTTKTLTSGNLDKSALEPLHIISYIVKRFDQNSEPSFKASSSSHFFKYKAASATSTLEIKVTDRFGNVYTETMARPKTFDTDTYKK